MRDFSEKIGVTNLVTLSLNKSAKFKPSSKMLQLLNVVSLGLASRQKNFWKVTITWPCPTTFTISSIDKSEYECGGEEKYGLCSCCDHSGWNYLIFFLYMIWSIKTSTGKCYLSFSNSLAQHRFFCQNGAVC